VVLSIATKVVWLLYVIPLYYHEVDYGAIGGVLYCHAVGMVVICGTFYYYQNI